jgi:hypothetical protein
MEESKDLKAGDTAKYKVGDETLIIEPMPFGRLKKVLNIVINAVGKLGKLEGMDATAYIPQLLEENIAPLMQLVFDKKKHPFINDEWVDDNITFYNMREIAEKVIMVNGLKDFLARMGKEGKQGPAPVTEQKK